MTPELAPPLLTTTPHQWEDVSALDRFNVHRCPTRLVFSGTGLELVTRQAMVRYLYHSATAATSLCGRQDFLIEGESTEPLNFNPRQRPRQQDWEGELVESGHFYVSRASLIRENLLQGKRCGYVEMPEELCIEIDSETDWIIAEKLLELYGYKKNVNELKEYYV
ncbi:n-acylneuraminate cytidylyltransferase [Trichonephila clavipes]|nr:n-acylneuraminate cytidylyltransferase [Trichonephila clavipes]